MKTQRSTRHSPAEALAAAPAGEPGGTAPAEDGADPAAWVLAAEEMAEDTREESLHAVAVRLHPRVDWSRMSETAIRRAMGLRPQGCPQRQEYEAGRAARSTPGEPPSEGSLAYRLGWQHGKPPRGRRRRWRARPAPAAPALKRPRGEGR